MKAKQNESIDLDLNKLTVLHDEGAHRFYIPLGDDKAVMEYAVNKKKIIFLHTEVPPGFHGKGIASRLAKGVLEYAASHDLVVISLCAYLSRYISRHPEYRQLQEVSD
jgi:predicted GNAT family acetyltransferase